jgi:hypothetical protein
VSVTGAAEVMANLRRLQGKMTAQLVQAVDRTGVDVANAAKRDHGSSSDRPEGLAAHAMGRYQNQTYNLTQSIMPKDAQVTANTILGVVETVERGEGLEYAARVERRYPFMFPALMGAKDKFIARVKQAMAV